MKKLRLLIAATTVGCFAIATAAAQGNPARPTMRSGSPTEHLPRNVTQLTWFGERAAWSPDGKRIAFMSKSFGDAFEIDVATKHIRLLTHYPHAGYLRVQYLPNGDYLLVGARSFQDVRKTRYSDQELWILPAGRSGQAVALDQKLTEGVAISRTRMKIAWAVDSRTHPGAVPAGTAIIYTGDVTQQDGKPVLANKREAVRLLAPECVGTEPQDFRNDDRELVFVCYSIDAKTRAITADVRGVDLASGEVANHLNVPDEYNEVEGLYPDGRYALVESSRDQSTATSKTIDIWKLRLDSKGADMRRLTRWGDFDGWKSSNPVVSPEGRRIAFQQGNSKDEAGVGYGIFMLTER
jgi:Tol biopolymer transport system component